MIKFATWLEKAVESGPLKFVIKTNLADSVWINHTLCELRALCGVPASAWSLQ